MTNPQKAKGDRAERTVRDWLRANGFPDCERTRAGYTRDAGDLHPCRGITVQVKDRAAYAWPEWMSQLAEQRAEAKADHAVLVLKRRGLGDAGEWLAVMPLEAMAALLKAAGYGVIADSAEIWPEHGDTGGIALKDAASHGIVGDAADLHRTQPTPAQESDHTPLIPPEDSPVPFVNPRTGQRAALATVAEVAQALHCSDRHIYNMLSRDELTRFQIGGLTRIDLNEIADLVTAAPAIPGGEVA